MMEILGGRNFCLEGRCPLLPPLVVVLVERHSSDCTDGDDLRAYQESNEMSTVDTLANFNEAVSSSLNPKAQPWFSMSSRGRLLRPIKRLAGELWITIGGHKFVNPLTTKLTFSLTRQSVKKFFQAKKVFKKFFFRRFPLEENKNSVHKFSARFLAFSNKISTVQKIVLSSSRGQGNFQGLEASRPRPRTSKSVLEAMDVLENSTSGKKVYKRSIACGLVWQPLTQSANSSCFPQYLYVFEGMWRWLLSHSRIAVRYGTLVQYVFFVMVRYVGTVRLFYNGTGTVRWYAVWMCLPNVLCATCGRQWRFVRSYPMCTWSRLFSFSQVLIIAS